MEIKGKEFIVRPLTIKQRRELSVHGFDLYRLASDLLGEAGKEKAIKVSDANLVDLLVAAFPGRESDLDAIGIVEQHNLFIAVLNASMSGAGEAEKN